MVFTTVRTTVMRRTVVSVLHYLFRIIYLEVPPLVKHATFTFKSHANCSIQNVHSMLQNLFPFLNRLPVHPKSYSFLRIQTCSQLRFLLKHFSSVLPCIASILEHPDAARNMLNYGSKMLLKHSFLHLFIITIIIHLTNSITVWRCL